MNALACAQSNWSVDRLATRLRYVCSVEVIPSKAKYSVRRAISVCSSVAFSPSVLTNPSSSVSPDWSRSAAIVSVLIVPSVTAPSKRPRCSACRHSTQERLPTVWRYDITCSVYPLSSPVSSRISPVALDLYPAGSNPSARFSPASTPLDVLVSPCWKTVRWKVDGPVCTRSIAASVASVTTRRSATSRATAVRAAGLTAAISASWSSSCSPRSVSAPSVATAALNLICWSSLRASMTVSNCAARRSLVFS